ncbi:hypothetical protein PR001_g17361 [Phytophthora rubi]|uniref:Uncharacterized protein n=1 Tax=Phytophthora rubi TaxID=129364 RepID=A0A6A3KL82_9STRA|nr:hypothetical protein PR001_g17361 [Phytophthora rubi]
MAGGGHVVACWCIRAAHALPPSPLPGRRAARFHAATISVNGWCACCTVRVQAATCSLCLGARVRNACKASTTPACRAALSEALIGCSLLPAPLQARAASCSHLNKFASDRGDILKMDSQFGGAQVVMFFAPPPPPLLQSNLFI